MTESVNRRRPGTRSLQQSLFPEPAADAPARFAADPPTGGVAELQFNGAGDRDTEPEKEARGDLAELLPAPSTDPLAEAAAAPALPASAPALPASAPALASSAQAESQAKLQAESEPVPPPPAAAAPTPLPLRALHQPPDHAARHSALDVSKSWIVQAPAGAGKTELLTQRFLTLLAQVDEPEEILAITFTRAATAEMRGRILGALEEAAAGGERMPGEPLTLTVARAALARSNDRGWQLLQQPHRLDVQTIDSLCMRLAHGQPLLSRLGGRLEPTEQAAPLYARAAQRTFARLGSAPPELEAALRHLLLMRDNHLGSCQRLVATMLERREQWRHVFILSELGAVNWEEVRSRLEAPFARQVQRVLNALHAAFAAEPTLVQELVELAQYACANGSRRGIGLLDGLQALPSPDTGLVEHWTCLRNFLLIQEGGWRKTINVGDGFPADGNGITRTERTDYKKRMEALLKSLQRDPARGERLRSLLASIPKLPAARYDEDQWQTLLSIFRVLRHAVAELHVAFAERNEVDFAELSIAAATVLDEEENTRGLLASEARRHLLIDEFQDTSRRQHQLIGRLLREWQPGDGRTCFLVGDPMQSIYIFRQAEVELFGRVQRRGLDCGSHSHPCHELTLSENFRSHHGLVDPLNRYFDAIFAAGRSEGDAEGGQPSTRRTAGEVPFAPSSAAAPALPGDSVIVHPSWATCDKPARQAARAHEVASVVALVEEQLPRIAEARASGAKSYTVAILGRAKNHLAPIAAALRSRGIAFRGIELETLAERQEILDLQSLLRALLHPAERIAWLSVLRAPWCGLTLGDLHTLVGKDDARFRYTPVPDLIVEHASLLTPDGQARLARVAQVLARAAADRFRRGHSLAVWLERTWVSLGAPAYLRPEELENTEVFFRLLADLDADGITALDGSLDTALQRLCAAPDASVSQEYGVQLMTIHKAKGLGFEVVIVPALDRTSARDSSPLVVMLERVAEGADQEPGDAASAVVALEGELGERFEAELDEGLEAELDEGLEAELDEVLVAPLGRQGEKHRTYLWIKAQQQQREASERKRLFYVACTRARQQLHLLGTAEITARNDLRAGAADSLLACAWPALAGTFAARQAEADQTPDAPTVQDNVAKNSATQTRPVLVPKLVPRLEPDPLLTPLVPVDSSSPEQTPLTGILPQLAAGASPGPGSEGLHLLQPQPSPPLRPEEELRLWRLPSTFSPRVLLQNVALPDSRNGTAAAIESRLPANGQRLERPEGSFEQRARGNAVHAMLELVSHAWAQEGTAAVTLALEAQLARTARAVLRAAGLAAARVEALTARLVPVVLAAAAHEQGRWILGPREGAQSEASWSQWTGAASTGAANAGASEARLRTLRVDRTFQAGSEPLEEGSGCLWIIDYKTGAGPGGIALEAYLEAQKEQWRPQLESYGAALRAFYRGKVELRYGLYFPELLRLKHWSG